jgi:hypothetical protein
MQKQAGVVDMPAAEQHMSIRKQGLASELNMFMVEASSGLDAVRRSSHREFGKTELALEVDAGAERSRACEEAVMAAARIQFWKMEMDEEDAGVDLADMARLMQTSTSGRGRRSDWSSAWRRGRSCCRG